jgi:light-regulated signal transduction histidine kinase (bacteriophytochrome)
MDEQLVMDLKVPLMSWETGLPLSPPEASPFQEELELFCRALSHDLRAPLRAMDQSAKVLLNSLASRLDWEEAKRFQKLIQTNEFMAELIDGLLFLSRVTRMEREVEPVDLSDLASAIATDLKWSDPDRRVRVRIAPELVVTGDPRLLEVALRQLFENAWKCTRHTWNAQITFGMEPAATRPTYFIRDNGIGFDMAYASKLFGIFEKLHSPAEVPGIGIGLAIVKQIIHRHGGRVWAKGEVRKGATFWFTLPSS